LGSQKKNQIWRAKTNEELDKLIKHKNVINYIKVQRLSWFGHVQRMPDTGTVKQTFNWKPLTKRSQGKPKYRWEDNIKQDICQMKIKNWIAWVQDRGKWKEGQNFQVGSSAPGRRRRRSSPETVVNPNDSNLHTDSHQHSKSHCALLAYNDCAMHNDKFTVYSIYIHLSIHLSIHPALCLEVCPSFHPFIHPR